MTANEADTAFAVAERLKASGPWEVFGERQQRFEAHFDGRRVETVRGPIDIEGYSIRLFRPADGALRVGRQAATDLSREGVARTVSGAESVAQLARFPARSIALPSGTPRHPGGVEVEDPVLRNDPAGAIEGFLSALFAAFEGRSGLLPSFGSVRARLSDVTIANSAGLATGYRHTEIDFELAIKAFGGPEGRPPGESWITASWRRLEPDLSRRRVDGWCRLAEDARRAGATEAARLPVLFSPMLLSEIVPPVLAARLSGAARLRKMSPEPGTALGDERLTVRHDGRHPWAEGSGPIDDEGAISTQRPLLDHGRTGELSYDALHAGAFEREPNGGAVRIDDYGRRAELRSLGGVSAGSGTIVVDPGEGGSAEEIAEAIGEGYWIDHVGWPNPDAYSGTFGGEIRLGYRIRRGRRAEPIRGGTVGGYVVAPPGTPSLLGDLVAVGTPTELEGVLRTPPLGTRGVTVSGA